MRPRRCAGTVRYVSVALLLVLASGCGGGGGGDSGSPTTGTSGSTFTDLAVTAFSAPAAGTAGGTYTITGTITNQGNVVAAGISAVVYLSPFSDVTVDGGMLNLDVYLGLLNPGQSWSFSIDVDLPDNVANGNYYIGVNAPYGPEPDISNNTRSQLIAVSGGTTCTQDAYESDNDAATAKPLAFGTAQTHNHCDATSDWLRFSADAGRAYGLMTSQVGAEAWTLLVLYDSAGQILLTGSPGTLEFGASRLTWTAPASGDYYVRVMPIMGTHSSGANTDYQVALGDMRPDLIVSAFFPPTTGLPGGNISVYNAVTNQGFAAAGSFPVDVYLSTDATVTSADTLIGSRTVSALAVNQTDAASPSVYQIPGHVTPGTYYIAAVANPGGTVSEFVASNNTSTVHTITIQAPVGACSGADNDAFEEDDTAATAKAITVGAAQSHNHCEDVSDWLSFAATAGQNYAIRLARTGGFSSAWVELYDDAGTTRLAGDGNSATSAIDWTAPSDGTYRIKVGANGFGADTQYTIKVDHSLPDLTESMFVVGTASVPAGGYLNISDTVTNAGHIPAGAFTIGVYASPDNVVTTTDTLVATRSLGSLLDASSGTSTSQVWHNAHFPRDLPLGTYYLGAIADHGGAVPEISETNNTSAPVTVNVVAPSCTWDAYEDDESPATAKPIAADETQARNYCDDGVDWIRFTPSVSGMYVASGGDRYISLYRSDGTSLITPHAASEVPAAISWSATAGETYYLKNHTPGQATGGPYSFTVYQCTPDAFEDDDVPASAKSIAVGATQSRNLCEDAVDWASFNAIAGTTYTAESTNANTGDYNVELTIFDTNGQTPLRVGSSVQGGKKYVVTWTAPASGTYYIQARPRIGTGTFSRDKIYTLRLN